MEENKKNIKYIIKSKVEAIKEYFYKLLGKDTTPIKAVNRDIPYMNKPISEENADEIGMEVYVDHLESAIEKGADMIAVVSGFGTGKSSLIELLKKRYHGWSEKQGKRCERIYCQINLWSQLENQGANEEEKQNQTLELHRTFLYQLISTIYPAKSSYFSRRTGRNFGMFKISAESPLWTFVITVTFVVFVGIAILQYFKDSLVTSGVFSEKTLSGCILLGYLICAAVVVLLVLRTEIMFSSGNSEGNRQVEENELIDLYRKYILQPKRWYSKLRIGPVETKHIVVVIEDLDRTQGGDSVYKFLKELRKYYVPNDQVEKHFWNQVTFIVNIMPEDKLREQCDSKYQNSDYVYDKVFDYTLNLNRIHFDNFDAVLESLIMEKRVELEKIGLKVYDSNNAHQIKGMQWIIYGKQLSLRQVKERLNESIVLFESIKEKFGDDKPEFEKCAAVACLRSAFSSCFYALSDSALEEMITWYAQKQPSEDEFVEEYGSKPGEMQETPQTSQMTQTQENSPEFYKTLYALIESHIIDENYRTYFFNYPKNSLLYNVKQTRVRNLIVYNEMLKEEMKTEVAQVAFETPEVIEDAFKKSIDLVKKLPTCVIYSPDLWHIASKKFSFHLTSLVVSYFANIKEVSPEHYTMLDDVVYRENSAKLLCQAILNNELTVIFALRTHILNKHIDVLPNYVDLFSLSSAPIDIEDLKKMKNISLKYVLQMTEGIVKELDDEVIDEICRRVLVEEDENILQKAAQFYIELSDVFEIVDVIDEVEQYMLKVQRLVPNLEEKIYAAVENEILDADRYFRLINKMPIEEIQENQIKRIISLNKPGSITEEICVRLAEEGYTSAYLLNMIDIYPNKISLSWDKVKDVFLSYGNRIWQEHSQLFHRIRLWACEKFKDEMVDLKEYFKAPYPLVRGAELRYMTLPDTVLHLYDASRAEEDAGDAFVEFCNRQFRKSDIAFAMFRFIANMEDEMIPVVFYKMNMQKVRFSMMSAKRKLQVVEDMRLPLGFNDSSEIVRFMDYTECLIPELEKEIASDLKERGNDILCKAYITAIQKYGKITKETIRNLRSMPKIYIYGDMLNQEMYKRKHYISYVCSKNLEEKKFTIEYEKLDTLWNVYVQIFKNTNAYEYTRARMCENKEFLKLIQNRKAYQELPEDSRMAMASILQDEDTLTDVLGYSDEFVIEYFSKIEGFSSKSASETFINIMEKHQKYAQNKTIYDNVYPKLGNANLKSKYTRLFKRANG